MTAARDRLEIWLGQNYSARVMKKGDPAFQLSEFKAALFNDEAMGAEAANHLGNLTENMVKRCFISQQHRSILLDALS